MKAVRNLEGQNKDVPVFAITGNAANFSEEQYLESGFNEVLVKPIDFDMLVELVNAYLNKKV
jgi:CheY-like chemotaxis protein